MKKILLLMAAMIAMTGCDKEPGTSNPTEPDISNPTEADEKVKSISFQEKEIMLALGESTKQEYIITPSTAKNKEVVWSCSNSDIISFNSTTGEVSAKKRGKTTITAKTLDGGFSASFNIQIFARPSKMEISDLMPLTSGRWMSEFLVLDNMEYIPEDIKIINNTSDIIDIKKGNEVDSHNRLLITFYGKNEGEAKFSIASQDEKIKKNYSFSVLSNTLQVNIDENGIQYYSKKSTGFTFDIMSKNIGAQSENETGNTYQWGNNTPVSTSQTANGAILGWNSSWNTSSVTDDWSINKQGPCPNGWFIPTKEDFAEIGGVSGVWLKTKRQIHYIVKVLNLPVWGCRDNKDGHKLPDNYKSDFWTSSKEGNTLAWYFIISLGNNTTEKYWNSFDGAYIDTDSSFPKYFSTGRYIRCIRK